MEFLKNNARGIIISLIVAGAIIGIASISSDDTDTNTNDEQTTSQNEDAENTNDNEANNGDNNENDEATNDSESGEQNEADEQASVDDSDEGFTSTAVKGDNQTVVVRRIVDRYLSNSETELSAEQKLYVETNLVNDIGRTDYIPVGEEIELAESTIEKRVEEAKNLSEAAIERWSQYL